MICGASYGEINGNQWRTYMSNRILGFKNIDDSDAHVQTPPNWFKMLVLDIIIMLICHKILATRYHIFKYLTLTHIIHTYSDNIYRGISANQQMLPDIIPWYKNDYPICLIQYCNSWRWNIDRSSGLGSQSDPVLNQVSYVISDQIYNWSSLKHALCCFHMSCVNM